jgi:hypothetical protein
MIVESSGGGSQETVPDRVYSIDCATVPVTVSPSYSPTSAPSEPPSASPHNPTSSPSSAAPTYQPTSIVEESEVVLTIPLMLGIAGIGGALVASFTWLFLARRQKKEDAKNKDRLSAQRNSSLHRRSSSNQRGSSSKKRGSSWNAHRNNRDGKLFENDAMTSFGFKRGPDDPLQVHISICACAHAH